MDCAWDRAQGKKAKHKVVEKLLEDCEIFYVYIRKWAVLREISTMPLLEIYIYMYMYIALINSTPKKLIDSFGGSKKINWPIWSMSRGW